MSRLSTYTLTFNCARTPVKPLVLASHLFDALPEPRHPPSVLVLCLQEIAPIAYSFLGGSYLQCYLNEFTKAVDIAGTSLNGASYVNIVNRNVGMTAMMVFVLREQTKRVRSLKTAEVGVGLLEMGNKGAVGVVMEFESQEDEAPVSLTFVSAHLAPMEWNVKRRNEDWKNIVRRLVFEPVSYSSLSRSRQHRLYDTSSSDPETKPLLSPEEHEDMPGKDQSQGIYTPTSYLVVAGDLNYRTGSAAPNQVEQHRFPQPCEDESYPRHYWHLLSSDQLEAERKAGRTMHGLEEAPVEFPPTYKYSEAARSRLRSGELKAEDIDKAESGSWEWAKHRWPSWCDRILYLDLPRWMDSTKRVKINGYTALPVMASSDHRPVACSLDLPCEAIARSTLEQQKAGGVRCNPPFMIDPYWKGRRRRARASEIVVGIAILLVTTWRILLVLLPIAIIVGFAQWVNFLRRIKLGP